MNITVRRTEKRDYRVTEEITRDAFWDLYVPGCDEHYLLHCMRTHADFVPELDYVALDGDRVVGNIVYALSHVKGADGRQVDTLTFGPISVSPEYQRKGIGSILIQTTRELVKARGCPAIIIYGHPYNYIKHGFVSGKKFGIGVGEGKYPSALLALVFDGPSFEGTEWAFVESPVYQLDQGASALFDASFPPREKGYRPSQEDFWISSRSFIVE